MSQGKAALRKPKWSNKMKPVAVVAGTRPEIIKMAPVIRALKKAKMPSLFVHCGQHHDYNMYQQFIENLELPAPDYGLKIKATLPGEQTAKIMIQMDKLFEKIKPSIVLVEGDTNSVLSAALASNKRVLPVGHVEAGLRSFDLRMPEEHNRRLTDHISNYLFAPTETAKTNLIKESVWGKIFVTGNTVIDAVNQHLPIAEKKSKILGLIPFDEFVLATAHRAENVDNIAVLKTFMEVFDESSIPIVYPMHPRTKKRLEQNNMLNKIKKMKNVMILPPLGYLDFLLLMQKSELIITDSGGVQEEATAPAIRKQVLVMRLSTERPEAVEAGFAKVVGTKKSDILAAIEKANGGKNLPQTSPYGDGKASEKIIEIVKSNCAA